MCSWNAELASLSFDFKNYSILLTTYNRIYKIVIRTVVQCSTVHNNYFQNFA